MEKLKRLFSIVKIWLVSNGVDGILGLIVGIILWLFGYKIFAGFSFGVFATRNWDILSKYIFKRLFNKK